MADLPGPDGRVSFREACTAANNTTGPQTIAFAIPDEPGQEWNSGVATLYMDFYDIYRDTRAGDWLLRLIGLLGRALRGECDGRGEEQRGHGGIHGFPLSAGSTARRV